MGFLESAKRAWDETAEPASPKPDEAAAPERREQRYEYDVQELREQALGGMPSVRLEKLLNERAQEGWQFKTLASTDVKGTVGHTDGWLAVFERET